LARGKTVTAVANARRTISSALLPLEASGDRAHSERRRRETGPTNGRIDRSSQIVQDAEPVWRDQNERRGLERTHEIEVRQTEAERSEQATGGLHNRRSRMPGDPVAHASHVYAHVGLTGGEVGDSGARNR